MKIGGIDSHEKLLWNKINLDFHWGTRLWKHLGFSNMGTLANQEWGIWRMYLMEYIEMIMLNILLVFLTCLHTGHDQIHMQGGLNRSGCHCRCGCTSIRCCWPCPGSLTMQRWVFATAKSDGHFGSESTGRWPPQKIVFCWPLRRQSLWWEVQPISNLRGATLQSIVWKVHHRADHKRQGQSKPTENWSPNLDLGCKSPVILRGESHDICHICEHPNFESQTLNHIESPILVAAFTACFLASRSTWICPANSGVLWMRYSRLLLWGVPQMGVSPNYSCWLDFLV